MKVLAVGDMHIKSSTREIMATARESLVKLAVTSLPDYIILLGDQLDGHSIMKLSCVSALTTLIEALVDVAPVIMLVGNHDMLNNQQYCSSEHAFASMKHIKNLSGRLSDSGKPQQGRCWRRASPDMCSFHTQGEVLRSHGRIPSRDLDKLESEKCRFCGVCTSRVQGSDHEPGLFHFKRPVRIRLAQSSVWTHPRETDGWG